MAGYCSPSEGVKFADLPNGLAAISKANLRVTKPMARFNGGLRNQQVCQLIFEIVCDDIR